MKKAFRILLTAVLIMVISLVLVVGLAIAYLNLSPRSGKAPSGVRLERIRRSPNHGGSKFVNPVATAFGTGDESMFSSGYRWLTQSSTRSPRRPLPTGWHDRDSFVPLSGTGVTVTWFGHSTALLQFEGKNVLLDPMFSDASSPFPFLGKRFVNDKSIPVDDLPFIDLVIVSHDHYDHLDHESIRKIKDRVGHFVTTLGVGSHLEYWGVPAERITELDWWQSTEVSGIQITATPSRHFSGRRVPESNNTLWASWVIKGEARNLFFSGDGGYFEGIKEIGQKYGPFDFALMECGQYNANWADIHMTPEQAIQAGIDVGGRLLMPIHWGAFDLSLHPWKEPPSRFADEAERLGVPVALPRIGESFDIASPPHERWWESLE